MNIMVSKWRETGSDVSDLYTQSDLWPAPGLSCTLSETPPALLSFVPTKTKYTTFQLRLLQLHQSGCSAAVHTMTSHCTFSSLDEASDSNTVFIFNTSASEKKHRFSFKLDLTPDQGAAQFQSSRQVNKIRTFCALPPRELWRQF